ncbi:ketopantoate reductase family protein [Flammeovirga sp. SJP92]|uniref:ketopantoate reductase family protein n=1 Tax=Flammeovirga sp. SJP92 TaxID=1775430 RepID=UPI000788AA97|nr:2-dehydropantoate 2-reductase [Flammeovirga sp. SJP92]KXX67043.1 2-dehydropantoate 2-reductase [Flammeovirga sp. SJP92]
MEAKNIIIIGLGGVGGYFGFKINQTNERAHKHQVSFIARGKTYDVVKNNGLTLLSEEHKIKVTKPDFVLQNIAEIKAPDLVLICVKEYDLENVCNQLLHVITEKTVILPMMNGANIYDRIRKIILHNTILPSCVYVASHIKEKGVVEHKGKAGKLIFGRDPQHFHSDVDWVVEIIENSAIDFEFTDNSEKAIWTKFFFIASFGLVTAKHNSSIGAVCADNEQRIEATNIMKEIRLIAQKKNIQLKEDLIDLTFKKASSFPSSTPTSLQLDVNSGKTENELELFAGAIIQYGKETGVETSVTQTILNEIKDKLKSLSTKPK